MSNFVFTLGHDDAGKAVRMDLPTLIETRLFDLASSGGGKSYALRVLVEKTAEHVQWILIDPEGEFASLREKFDFLLVGKDGEVPVDARSAKLLARKIMETRASVIVDLYGLAELGVTWVAHFLPELMSLPKTLWSPVIVAIDEAHKYARETVKGGEHDAAYVARKAVINLSDSGRKQSRGCVIATQRLSKLAADARAELRNNLIGLTVQDLDRDRAGDILGIPKKQNELLRELHAGEFYAFGPAFVSHRGVFKMKVDAATTRHPKPGEGKLLAVPKASEAVKDLLGQMGDVPAQAQAEGDALTNAQRQVLELTRKLSERERELKARPVEMKQAAPVKETVYVDRPVLNGEVKMFLEGVTVLKETLAPLKELPALFAPVTKAMDLILVKVEQVQRAQVSLTPQGTPVRSEFVRPVSPNNAQYTTRPTVSPAPKSVYENFRKRETALPSDVTNATEGEIGKGERIILTAAAQYQSGVTREQLTILTGYKRSSRDTYLQRLTARGFVAARGSMLSATAEGFAALGDFEPLPTGSALQDYWLNRLSGGEKEILRVALESYPDALERSALDEATGYKRSSRDTYIQRLQARRLVTAERGTIRASDELFD